MADRKAVISAEDCFGFKQWTDKALEDLRAAALKERRGESVNNDKERFNFPESWRAHFNGCRICETRMNTLLDRFMREFADTASSLELSSRARKKED